MIRYLMDSGIAAAYLNRRGGVYERVKAEMARGNRVGVAVPVLAELAYGLEASATRDRNMRRLRTALGAWYVWPFDQKGALEYGRIAAELRRLGRPMQVVDMMIAAVAFGLRNCVVVSTDSDLRAVPRLTVENWLA